MTGSSPEVNMPHDLDTSTRGIGARLVHRDKQSEVLARIDDDDRAKPCRSAIFHDYGMQIGIPVPHIVDPGHGLLVESIGHDVNRLLRELHGRDQFIRNWLAVHFLVPEVGLAEAQHVASGRTQATGGIPGKDRPTRSIVAVSAMSWTMRFICSREGRSVVLCMLSGCRISSL